MLLRQTRRQFLETALILAAAPVLGGETPPNALAQNRRLGRGVNIIGYDPLWKNREKARFQCDHFRLIREAGFQHVRINLHPFRDTRSDDQNPVPPRWYETLDWAVEQALANGLQAVLDFHEFHPMSRDPEGLKERFLTVWTEISERCKDKPNEVLFEILNEPHDKLTPELWNGYLRDALAVIRRTNPDRTVVIGPGNYNGIGELDSLDLPQEDQNIIATVHFYSPMEFTHQGAPWSEHRDKSGVTWGSPEDREAVVRTFDKVQAWSEKTRRPIYLGEFGAYDKADMDSRVRYTDFVAREAEKRDWSWAYWQFDSDFILYDIPAGKWIEPIRDALIPPKAL